MEVIQAQARDEVGVVMAEGVGVGVEVATIGLDVEVEVAEDMAQVAEDMARRVAEVAPEEEEARTPGSEEAVVAVEDFDHIS